jgi:hypothetical protein
MTLYLLAAVVVIGGALFRLQRTAPSTDQQKASERRIFSFSEKQVEGFRIHKDYWTDISCERATDGAWMLAGQSQGRADQAKVAQFLSLLEFTEYISRSKMEGPITPQLAKYGLQTPRLTIAITAARRTSTLLVGAQEPGGSGLFALMKEQGMLLVIPESIFTTADRDAGQWREREPQETAPPADTSMGADTSGRFHSAPHVVDSTRAPAPAKP